MTQFNLTREEKGLFEALKKSAIGPALADYVERLMGHLCDARNMKDLKEPTRIGHLEASKILETHLVAKIRTTAVRKPPKRLKDAQGRVLNPFE